MKMHFILLVLLLTLFLSKTEAQVVSNIIDCNSIYAVRSSKNLGQEINFAFVLERLVVDDIWLSLFKKHDNEKEVLFESLTPGKYRVKYSRATGDSKIVSQDEIITSNIVEIVNCGDEAATWGQTKIKVFPNPASETATITLTSIPSGKSVIVLRSVLGEPLKSLEVIDDIISISVHELPGGIYFLDLLADGKRLATAKLVVD